MQVWPQMNPLRLSLVLKKETKSFCLLGGLFWGWTTKSCCVRNLCCFSRHNLDLEQNFYGDEISGGKKSPTVYQSKQMGAVTVSGKHKGLFELFKEDVTNAISIKKETTLRAAVSKLLFPDISTTIVSQEIFWGLDELLPFLIFWVKENLLFFLSTALFQFSRRRADDADDCVAAVPSPHLRPSCQRLRASEMSQSKSFFGFNELRFRTPPLPTPQNLAQTPEIGPAILEVMLQSHSNQKQSLCICCCCWMLTKQQQLLLKAWVLIHLLILSLSPHWLTKTGPGSDSMTAHFGSGSAPRFFSQKVFPLLAVGFPVGSFFFFFLSIYFFQAL